MGRWDHYSQDTGKVFSLCREDIRSQVLFTAVPPGEGLDMGEWGMFNSKASRWGLQEGVQSVGVNDLRGVGFDLFQKTNCAFVHALLC